MKRQPDTANLARLWIICSLIGVALGLLFLTECVGAARAQDWVMVDPITRSPNYRGMSQPGYDGGRIIGSNWTEYE